MTEIAHAKLSASGSAKWLNCPGSYKAELPYPNTSNEHAKEGTQAHELADICLKAGQEAIEFVDRDVLGKPITGEMAEYVQEYIDYVKAFETDKTLLITEHRVDYSHVVPEGFGTLDAAVVNFDKRHVDIFDLKYGFGFVDANRNTQGQIYAVGLYEELSLFDTIETFTIHICMPRAGTWTKWDITVEELMVFAEFMRKQAELALSDNAPRVAGKKQCEWCRAKDDCETRIKFAEDLISEDFAEFVNDEPTKPKSTISDERRKFIKDNEDLILDIIKSNNDLIYQRLNQGKPFFDYKLVLGKTNRKFIDDAAKTLQRYLGKAEAYKQSLIGIGDAEKKLKKKIGAEKAEKIINKLTFKPEGKLNVAPWDDKRPAVIVEKADDMFIDFDDHFEEEF